MNFITSINKVAGNQLELQVYSAGLKTDFDMDWKDNIDFIRPKSNSFSYKIPDTGLLTGSWYAKFMYDEYLYIVENAYDMRNR